jgi:DNA-binding response OmpR family regulator
MTKGPKIAIIEDDAALVQMYRTKFQMDGYEVQTAPDGLMGLELLAEYEPEVILLDLMMPNMTGLDMLAEYKKRNKDSKSKVIVLTNVGNDATITQAREMGAVDYIVKAEMTPSQVAEKVKTILAK